MKFYKNLYNRLLKSIAIWIQGKCIKLNWKIISQRFKKDPMGQKYPPPDPEVESILSEYINSNITINDFDSYTRDIIAEYSKYSHIIEMASFGDGGCDDVQRASLGLPKSIFQNEYFVYLTCTCTTRYNKKVLFNTLIVRKDDPKILSIIRRRLREKKLNEIL